MSTLRELADDLGPAVLQVAAAPMGLDVELSGGLVLHDPTEQVEVGQGDLVIAIGLTRGPEAWRLLSEIAAAGAAGLVVRQPVAGRDLASRAEQAGIALLGVRQGSPWTHVVVLLSSALSRGSFGVPGERLAGAEPGDLFAIANVVAKLVDAPITIEDPRSRLIAFSGRQEEADPARTEVVLGRRVPDTYVAELQRLGVFRRLLTEREPIYIADVLPGVMPRLAVAIRAGDQVLGSIWAAVRERPSRERERALADAANFVALHLLRHRLISDMETSLEAELLGTVLGGGGLAEDAAQRLHLTGPAFCVVAVGLDLPEEPEAAGARLGRSRNLLALHLSSIGGRAALVGGGVYAIVPAAAPQRGPSPLLRQAAEHFVERAAKLLQTRVMVALGSRVEAIADAPASRASADEVLRVMRGARPDLTVADLGDVRAEVLLLRFAEACRDDPTLPTSPLVALQEHDREHRTAHVATCRAYLDAFGDIDATARALGIHHNTVRYRLRQIRQLTGVRLDDSTERLALMLELRLL